MLPGRVSTLLTQGKRRKMLPSRIPNVMWPRLGKEGTFCCNGMDCCDIVGACCGAQCCEFGEFCCNGINCCDSVDACCGAQCCPEDAPCCKQDESSKTKLPWPVVTDTDVFILAHLSLMP